MATELLFGVYVNPESSSRIKLSCVDLKTKVDTMKVMISDKANLKKDLIDLVYCGCILEDDATLESYGLKNGAMVHVLKKKIEIKKTPPAPVPEATILQLASTFKSFSNNASLRSALHRLSKRPESLENIILSTPGLYEDAVAMAMLQDPDLMAHFTDPNTVRKIAELHPVLLEAAQMIAAVVHLDARNAASAPGPSSMNVPPTTYPYGLENLSEDEDMTGDSSQSSDSPLTNGSPYPSTNITASQLARALSRAGTRSSPSSSSSSSTTTASTGVTFPTTGINSTGLNSQNSGLITTEMFSQAIQQAFAVAGGGGGGGTRSSSGPTPTTVLPQTADYQRQLTQMHEIGLMDDSANIQALQFTNGDVQAAIELVFSGFSDNL